MDDLSTEGRHPCVQCRLGRPDLEVDPVPSRSQEYLMLRFIDSFDHYAASETVISKKWSGVSGSFSFGTGRFGTNGFSTANRNLVKSLTAEPEMIYGFAFKPSGNSGIFLHAKDGGTTQVGIQYEVGSQR